ncbi:MAG: hypothetical protein JKY95_16095 [Planctomycetaceae bacterium]|nr:hypothetical protein [Planctomycetaceae bacterium]
MKHTTMVSSIKRTGYTLSLLAVGYVLGVSGSLIPQNTNAQPAADGDDIKVEISLSNESIEQVQNIHESLNQLMETMKLEDKYTAATEGVNPYLILTGGGNAIEDLELGTGVDPVTFAALYAGQATSEVEDDLSWDQSNRLMYKNKLVRIYSVEKLNARQETLKTLLAKRVSVQ